MNPTDTTGTVELDAEQAAAMQPAQPTPPPPPTEPLSAAVAASEEPKQWKFLKRYRRTAKAEPGTVLYDATYEANGHIFYLCEWDQAAFSAFDAARAEVNAEMTALEELRAKTMEEVGELNADAMKRQEDIAKQRELNPDADIPDADISDIQARGEELNAQAPIIEDRVAALYLARGKMYDEALIGDGAHEWPAFLVGLREPGSKRDERYTREDIETGANSFKQEIVNVLEQLSTPGKVKVNFLAKR